jgi:hypothetical protein
MSLIDSLLGPRDECVIEDGEGGQFVASFRPRRNGPPVLETTMVSFRRLGQRSSQGFGCRLWMLRLAADPAEWHDPIVDSSISFTPTAARNAVDWIDGLMGST